MNLPGPQTSNYGWALWHLDQAEKSGGVPVAQMHGTLAQARATLALVDEQSGIPVESTVWETPSTPHPGENR